MTHDRLGVLTNLDSNREGRVGGSAVAFTVASRLIGA